MGVVGLLFGLGMADRHDNALSDNFYSSNLQSNDARAGQSTEAEGVHHSFNYCVPSGQLLLILPYSLDQKRRQKLG